MFHEVVKDTNPGGKEGFRVKRKRFKRARRRSKEIRKEIRRQRLIHEKFGNFILLGTILLDAEVSAF